MEHRATLQHNYSARTHLSTTAKKITKNIINLKITRSLEYAD